ncbi:MAG: SpoIID/LytB domain-containing protein [Solirubrobacteraceae bacterium]|nr:SpoIID/LytB domain-containing protein [Solirubrobacteraceae bacterium]
MPSRSSLNARIAAVVSFAAGAALVPVAPASAAVTVVAKGAGFGHGIGMSQYGAYGQAKAGRTANQILTHYYRGTVVSKGDTSRTVRVLLRNSSSVRFSGAATLVGSSRSLSTSATYVMKTSGSSTVLTSSRGKKIASVTGAMRVAAPAGSSILVAGSAINGVSSGRYRGAIELRSGQVINQLTVDDYVRGVVAGESPASWPAAALQAQSIAARTYGITSSRTGDFDLYPDTRSQVYRGVSGETPTTNAAVAATAGQYVTYQGKPINAYFFSTSGGRTENVEHSFLGATPQPYLKSVDDPWDKASPRHRWQIKYTRASLQRKLGGWVKGTLQSIDVVKRGVSPRVVRANVVGTKGRTTVTGPQLRARLGLNDTWVQFVFSNASTKPLPAPPSAGADAPASPPEGGVVASRTTAAGALLPSIGQGVLAQVIAQPPGYGTARGRVWPDGGGRVVRLQIKSDGRWRTTIRVRADQTGRWTSLVPIGVRHRVVALGTPGPIVLAE